MSATALHPADDLCQRARTLANEHRALAGLDPRVVDKAHVERAVRDTTALREQLRAALHETSPSHPGAAADVCEQHIALTALLAALREHAVAQRFATLARINEALAGLRDARSVPELLQRTAAVLCTSCDFDRAVISRVQGTQWKAEVVHARAPSDPDVDRVTRAFLGSEWIPLERSLLETELVRRRLAALITDPGEDERAYRPMIEATSTRGYVAAPVMPAGRVIGFLHADCYDSGRELTVTDRDNLWIFAEGFGLVFESLVLGGRLAEQRAQALDAFRTAVRQINELCDADVQLDEGARRAAPQDDPAEDDDVPSERVDLLLTAREREVLDLMVTGARNRQIADRLVISESTVKAHVVRIRRKLRAGNRAEAVARYLHLRNRRPS